MLAVGNYSNASGAVSLPYESDMNPADGWTIFDANADNNTWKYNTSASNWKNTGFDAGLMYEYSERQAANDWAISPAIRLEAGKSYKVSHWAKEADSSCPEKYNLYYGIIASPENYADLLASDPIWEGEGKKNLTINFAQNDSYITANATGDYYFGFKCLSDPDQYNLFITGFSISEFGGAHPGAATGVKVTLADEGRLEAILSWTWPTLSDTGAEYSGTILGAKIYRSSENNFEASDDTFVLEYAADGIVPGESVTFSDTTVPYAGKWYYRVIPYDANGLSESASTLVNSWIGSDIPNSTITVTATLDATDNSKVTVTFSKPIGNGVNGKYVDLSQVYYQIVRKNGKGQQTLLYSAFNDGYTFQDVLPEFDGYTYVVNYADATGNLTNTSRKGESPVVVGGGYLQLPYSNQFESASDIRLFSSYQGTSSTYVWKVNEDREELQSYHGGSSFSAADQGIFTPAMQLEEGNTYSVAFDLRGYNGTANYISSLKVRLATANTKAGMNEADVLLAVDAIDWTVYEPQKVEFTVPASGVYYIGFQDCSLSRTASYIYIDNLVLDVIKPIVVDNLTRYKTEFKNEDLDRWTLLSADEDEDNTWQLDEAGNYLYATASGSMAVSPALHIEPDTPCMVELEVAGGSDSDDETISLYILTEPASPKAVKARRVKGTPDGTVTLSGKDVQAQTVEFTAPEGGVCYIGLEAQPAVGSEGVKIHSFAVATKDFPTSVATLGTDAEQVRYFDLNGIEVRNPQKGSVLIRMQGSRPSKFIVR